MLNLHPIDFRNVWMRSVTFGAAFSQRSYLNVFFWDILFPSCRINNSLDLYWLAGTQLMSLGIYRTIRSKSFHRHSQQLCSGLLIIDLCKSIWNPLRCGLSKTCSCKWYLGFSFNSWMAAGACFSSCGPSAICTVSNGNLSSSSAFSCRLLKIKCFIWIG
jgi:hypothetical protein